MARMLRKSRTLGWEACACGCGDKAAKRVWRRIARRKEARAWRAEM